MSGKATQARSFLSPALAAMVPAACVQNGMDSALPTSPRSRIEATGAAGGTLTFDDECLRLRTPSEHYLVIWTKGTRLDRSLRPPDVTDQKGVRRRVGSHVILGGGEISEHNIRKWPHTFAVISRCGGPLWLTHGFMEPAR